MEGGDDDFFKDYPNPAAQQNNPPAGGGDFFSSDFSAAPQTNGVAAQGGDNGFVMNDAPKDDVEVEDVDDDDDDERPSTPPAIKQWRIDFAARLEKKQEYEKRVRAETQTEAKATIQSMHNRWQERVSSNKQVNQDFEKKFIAERDAVLNQFSKPGEKPNWNVLPHLANLSGSYAEGQRDTSRMRSVILKLKSGCETRTLYVVPTKEYAELCDKIPRSFNRVNVVEALQRSLGFQDLLQCEDVQKARIEDLEAFHSRDYLNALENPPENEEDLEDFGLVDDCPSFDGMLMYALLTAGGSLRGAEALCRGEVRTAIWYGGGRHHAKWSSASGFCYINDVVLAISLLQKNLGKVLYVDLDAHHGDGVEEAFITTSDVLTLSFHRFGRGFFPGTGEMVPGAGMGRGRGYAINLPLTSNTSDAVFVPLVLEATKTIRDHFKPAAVVLVAGPDCLAGDPLGELNITINGLTSCVQSILDWHLPTLILGGGGYCIPNVARAFGAITAAAIGKDLPQSIPENDYFELFGPDFTFRHSSSISESADDEYLLQLRSDLQHCIAQLKQIQ